MDDIEKRLQEIELGQILLGRYTGCLAVLYSDKLIDKEYYLQELRFTLDLLVGFCGIGSEDVEYVTQMIEEVR